MLVTADSSNIVTEREQLLQEVARIEGLPRPEKWHAIRDFTLKMHPGFIPAELDFIAAVTELRESNNFKKTGASKSGDMRHLMKIPQYIYTALIALDPDLFQEMASGNGGSQQTWRKLYNAFPMYRASRIY